VILHGLFGSGRNWGNVARQLSDQYQCHLLDARNHGDSPWDDSMTYVEMADDVFSYIERSKCAPATLIGHSMGGKTAMIVALQHPDLIERLIVVDIAPVAYHGHDEHGAYAAAMLSARLDAEKRRHDIEVELAPSIPDPVLRAFLMQNLVGDANAFRWRVNLPAIISNLSDLTGFPDITGTFDKPVDFLIGERSNYVRPRDEAAIRRFFPQARISEIPEAGHWPHAEKPEKFMALIRHALTRQG
jgi:pimeloyl-ACP methyl ester carboxylesterase